MRLRPEAAHARHSLGLVSEQSLYSLFTRVIELEVLPAAEHYGMGVIAWSPLAGGKLGGRSEKRVRRGTAESRHDSEELSAQLDRWEAVCAERDLAPGQVALAVDRHVAEMPTRLTGYSGHLTAR